MIPPTIGWRTCVSFVVVHTLYMAWQYRLHATRQTCVHSISPVNPITLCSWRRVAVARRTTSLAAVRLITSVSIAKHSTVRFYGFLVGPSEPVRSGCITVNVFHRYRWTASRIKRRRDIRQFLHLHVSLETALNYGAVCGKSTSFGACTERYQQSDVVSTSFIGRRQT